MNDLRRVLTCTVVIPKRKVDSAKPTCIAPMVMFLVAMVQETALQEGCILSLAASGHLPSDVLKRLRTSNSHGTD